MIALAVMAFIDRAVNQAERPCPAWYKGGGCSDHWRPDLAGGDCKQFAAAKLQELILAGAAPGEFTVWITRRAQQKPGQHHAVLIHNPTQMVLDVPMRVYAWGQPVVSVSIIESRAFKAKYEGLEFEHACPECGVPAEVAARAIQAARIHK